MRTLSLAPPQITFGSFQGALPRIDWGVTGVARVLRSKTWLYLGVASEDVWLSLAILRTGYASNILAYVFDRKANRMIFDKTVVAPPMMAKVATDVHRAGVIARYSNMTVERSGPDLAVRARYGGLDLDLTIDESAGPPGIVAMTDFGEGLMSATEKRALASVRGKLSVDGRSFDLTGGIAGWDYTNGLLPRHTVWKWAFALGKDVAFNLVEGFVNDAECAAFADGKVHPLPQPHFTFDRDRPELPWKIEGEGIDLRFDVGAVHAQHTNLLVARSHFLQPVGAFFGTVRIGDRDVKIDGIPGVVEDQDVVW